MSPSDRGSPDTASAFGEVAETLLRHGRDLLSRGDEAAAARMGYWAGQALDHMRAELERAR